MNVEYEWRRLGLLLRAIVLQNSYYGSQRRMPQSAKELVN